MQAGWRDVGTGKGQEAANNFLLALFVGPERPDAYWGLGVASHIVNFPLQTITACFDRAIASLHNVAPLFSDYGRVLEQRDVLPDAIAFFNKALAIDNNHLEAHIGLARSYQKMGDAENANVHWKRVKELKEQIKL